MAIDLGGIARGLGAAGVGYLGGEVKGEQERYRREQIAANEALKRDALAQQKELVGLRRKELDPKKTQREAAAHILQELTTESFKPEFQSYRLRYPDFDKHYAAAQAHLGRVINGQEDFDPSQVSWLTELEHPNAGGGDAAARPELNLGLGGGVGTGGGFQAGDNPRLDSFLKPSAPPAGLGMAPPQPLLASNQLQIPPRQGPPPPTFGSVPPEVLANEVLQDFPGSPRVLPAPKPKVAAAAPAPTQEAPPPPQSPSEKLAARYFSLLEQGPPAVSREPGMTDKAYRDAVKDARSEWTAETDRMQRSLSVLPDAEFKRLRNLYGPELYRQKVVGGVAKIEGTRATTKQTKALTPVKVEQGHAAIKKTNEEAKAIPQRVVLQGRAVATGEKNADTNAGRLAETQQYHADLLNRAKQAVGEKSLNADDRRDHEIVAARLRILTAKMRRASGADQPQFPEDQRQRAQQEMEEALGRINDRRGKAAPPAPAAAAVKPPPAPKGQPAITKGEIQHVQAALALGPGPLKKWLDGLPPAARARFKQVQASIGR